jgi:hypothetical protein
MIIRVKRGDPLACLVPVQIYTMRPTRTIITYAYNSLKIWDAFRRCASEKAGKRQCRYELFRLRAVSAKARERREARQHRAKARPYPKNLEPEPVPRVASDFDVASEHGRFRPTRGVGQFCTSHLQS